MYTKKILEYIGNINQAGGMKRYTLSGGRAEGVGCIDIDNASGLNFTVIADRGMDIGQLSFKGIPVSFLSKTGIVSPSFYNEKDDEWLRSFGGGFLTTCGLSQVGDPCEYNGTSYGLHGSYSNTPADDVSVVSQWIDDQYVMRISGEIKQTKVQFENLSLNRSVTVILGVNEIRIDDIITNQGWQTEPYMILYHMNFGYPFLNPETDIVIPSKKVTGWDAFSADNIERHLEINEPDENAPELTYYHEVGCNDENQAKFMLTNNKTNPDIAVVVEYDKGILNNLTQWKYLRKGEYVMALEPCNNLVRGLDYESRNGDLKYIRPQETVKISMKIRFIDSVDEIGKEKTDIISRRDS